MKRIVTYSVFVIVLTIGFVECKTTEPANDAFNIKVHLGRKDNPQILDDIIEISHYVILDPSLKVIIGGIDKLQLFDNKIGIMDKSTNSAFMFDLNGKLLYSWSFQGRGPNEYSEMTDIEFTISEDLECNVYDRNSGRILKYAKTGELISTMQTIPNAHAFKLLNDGVIAFNMGNGVSDQNNAGNFNYICTKDGDVVIKSLPFHKDFAGRSHEYSIGKSYFYYYENRLFMSTPNEDTVYEVFPSGDLSPYVTYDMNIKRPSSKSSAEDVAKYRKSYNSGETPSTPHHFYKFNGGTLVEYSFNQVPYIMISDKNHNSIFNSSICADKNGIFIFPIPYLDSDNSDYLISYMSPSTIELWKKLCIDNKKDITILNDISNKTVQDGNPILIFYKWIYN